MIYFKAKADLKFMQSFRKDVLKLMQIEHRVQRNLDPNDFFDDGEYQAVIQTSASQIEGYQGVRRSVAKGTLRAERIARQFGIPIIFESYPAPAVGGPVIRQGMFSAILQDMSHGGQVTNQMIDDAMNQTIGECEAQVTREFWRLINPIYWIKEIIVLIIRIPFIIVQASGFDVSKIEDHFFAKAFKLFEVIAIIYILIRLGMEKESIKDILLKLF